MATPAYEAKPEGKHSSCCQNEATALLGVLFCWLVSFFFSKATLLVGGREIFSAWISPPEAEISGFLKLKAMS